TFCGTLSLIQSPTISARPITNGALTKLCTYLAACATLLNASGTDHWRQHDFPERDVQPGQPEDHKGYGGQPMREAFKGAKAWHRLPGTPLRNPEPPHNQIGGAESCDHAKDHDRTEPMQGDFVEMIP